MNKEELVDILSGLTIVRQKHLEEKAQLLLEKYYGRRENFNLYKSTKDKLTQMVIEGNFPTVQEWNKIAYAQNYYSSISIKYIERCDWREIEKRITNEIKNILKNVDIERESKYEQ